MPLALHIYVEHPQRINGMKQTISYACILRWLIFSNPTLERHRIIARAAMSSLGQLRIPTRIKTLVWDQWIGADKRSGECIACRDTIQFENKEIAHVVASAKGGTDQISNLRICCGACNRSMGTKNLNEFVSRYFPHVSQMPCAPGNSLLNIEDETPWLPSCVPGNSLPDVKDETPCLSPRTPVHTRPNIQTLHTETETPRLPLLTNIPPDSNSTKRKWSKGTLCNKRICNSPLSLDISTWKKIYDFILNDGMQIAKPLVLSYMDDDFEMTGKYNALTDAFGNDILLYGQWRNDSFLSLRPPTVSFAHGLIRDMKYLDKDGSFEYEYFIDSIDFPLKWLHFLDSVVEGKLYVNCDPRWHARDIGNRGYPVFKRVAHERSIHFSRTIPLSRNLCIHLQTQTHYEFDGRHTWKTVLSGEGDQIHAVFQLHPCEKDLSVVIWHNTCLVDDTTDSSDVDSCGEFNDDDIDDVCSICAQVQRNS